MKRGKPKLKPKTMDVVRSVAALIANEAVSHERLDRLDAIVRNLSLYGRPTCEVCLSPLPINKTADGERKIEACEFCPKEGTQETPDVH